MTVEIAAVIEFVVPGVPQQQGSKNRWGGEDNPRVKGWRAQVADAAYAVMLGGPLRGPVEVEVEFVFPRPKNHYGSGRNALVIKPSAPHWHSGTPDLDKLQRAIGDALTGVILLDDRQIASWVVTKRYGTVARAEIAVRELMS